MQIDDDTLQQAKADGVEVVIMVYDPRGTASRIVKRALSEQRRVRVLVTKDRASFYDAETALKKRLKEKTK